MHWVFKTLDYILEKKKIIPDKKLKFNWEFFWAPGKQDQRETTYGHQSSVL